MAPGDRRSHTAQEIFFLLFGDPDIPGDTGRLGRLEASVRGLERLLMATFLTVLAAVLALFVNLIRTHLG